MNKKTINLLTDKLPIVSVIILILIYIYLSIPDNFVLQLGGAPVLALPKKTPAMYKFRWVFIIIPVLLLMHLIYSIYYTRIYIPSLPMWNIGIDFFGNFQKQFQKLIALKKGLTPSISNLTFNYKNISLDAKEAKNDPDIYKLYNSILLNGDPLSTGYTSTQYFCRAFRPCTCCKEKGYVEWFTSPSFSMKTYCDTPWTKSPSNS
jgi:hypothetical protein